MRTATTRLRLAAMACAAALTCAGCASTGGAAASPASPTVTVTTTTSVPDPTTSTTSKPTTTTTTTTTTPAPWPASSSLARSAVSRVDALNTDGRLYAVAVYDRANKKLVSGRYATMPIMSASVIKLFVIVELLHERERGEITMSSQDLSWIGRSLSGSDDTAMNALWSKYDGMRALTRLRDLAGLHDTEAPEDPAQWGEATISAADAVAVYRYVLTSLTAADRDLVIGALAKPTHYGLADDFDQYFGFLGPGVRPDHVAAKQGWIGYRPYRLLHSTALLGSRHQYIAVILTRQSNGYSYPDVAAHVTEAAEELLEALGKAGTR